MVVDERGTILERTTSMDLIKKQVSTLSYLVLHGNGVALLRSLDIVFLHKLEGIRIGFTSKISCNNCGGFAACRAGVSRYPMFLSHHVSSLQTASMLATLTGALIAPLHCGNKCHDCKASVTTHFVRDTAAMISVIGSDILA